MYVTENGTLVISDSDSTVISDITIANVSARLAQLGYTVTDDDTERLKFETGKIIDYVLNYCNITTIPAILNPRIIDRICGEFLFYKKNSGQLTTFDYDATIKSIKEGDTTLTYAVGQEGDTPESRFDSFVKQLERGFDKWLVPHRKLRW